MGRKPILSEVDKMLLKDKVTQQSMQLSALESVGVDRGFNLEVRNQIKTNKNNKNAVIKMPSKSYITKLKNEMKVISRAADTKALGRTEGFNNIRNAYSYAVAASVLFTTLHELFFIGRSVCYDGDF